MSTLLEIQAAVSHLPSDERKALQLWLDSQAEPEMTAQEEQRLTGSKPSSANRATTSWRGRRSRRN